MGRYEAIGGTSPLAARTAEQVAGIQAELDLATPGCFSCILANKHSEPKIENAVAQLASKGVSRLVGLVLAPHYSKGSVGEYLDRASVAAESHAISVTFVEHWHDNPVLIELLAERTGDAVASLGPLGERARENGELLLLVTAHSLPVRVVAGGDPYADQLRRTAELVAARSGLARFEIGWQSAGRTPEPWLGPDILEKLRSLPGENISAVVVCAAGFTSDHLEVLYDLDIEARRVAEEVNVAFARTRSLNAEPRMCAALADLVIAASRGAEL